MAILYVTILINKLIFIEYLNRQQYFRLYKTLLHFILIFILDPTAFILRYQNFFTVFYPN